MKSFKFVFGVLTLVFSFNALAQSQDCSDASSTMEMKACMDKKLQTADAVLNKSYQEVKALAAKQDKDNDGIMIGVPKGEVTRRLVAAEKAWITFRDTSCDLQATEMLGGTGEGLVNLSCLVDQTTKRTQELNDLKKEWSGQ